jgi:hypothetical protein
MTFSCTNDEPKEVTSLKSIVEIAKADPANFSILVDALKKTSLDATLGNAGSTVLFYKRCFLQLRDIVQVLSALTAQRITSISYLKLILQNHGIELDLKI